MAVASGPTGEGGGVPEQDAVSKFQQWLRENKYEDAVEVCPYDGREGGYQGAVDAWDVVHEYIGECEEEPSPDDYDALIAYAADIGQFADPKIWGDNEPDEIDDDFDEEAWMVAEAERQIDEHPSEEEIAASTATLSDGVLCEGKTAKEWRDLYFYVLERLHAQNAQTYSGDES